MEVAFFTDSYAPTHDGVAELTRGVAQALRRLGVGVRVYAPHPVVGARPEDELLDGVEVIRCRSLPVPYYGQYRWGLFPFSQLRGRQFGSEVDVVHLHTAGIMGTAAFMAARRWKKPLVGTFHTNLWAMRDSFPKTLPVRLFFRAAWWYTLGTYWRCDAVTAPTTDAAETIVSSVRKPLARPVEVIHHGIAVDRFRPGIAAPDWRARCGLGDRPVVTYLGRLTADKGIHRFLDAVEQLASERPVTALVGGVGPEEAAVRARLAKGRLAECARYVGSVTESEKPALLSQSDLFVLPSISDNFPLSVVEAMASGATVVASDRGGLPELVRDGSTGRIAPLEPPGAMARIFGELLDDPAERSRLARNAREWVVQSASIDSVARRFISLYELLLSDDGFRRGTGARRASRAGAARAAFGGG